MTVTFCMVAGDISKLLASDTGYTFIQLFYNVTDSHAGASAMVSIIIVTLVFGCVTNFATSSRQMWAFARDNGLPFSGFLSTVRPGYDIPMNAVLTSYVFAMLLSLINLGSAAAFNIITSLATGALLCSYIVSITCIIIKRIRGEPLLPRRWDLGRLGLPMNIIAVLFLTLIFVLSFFPQSPADLTAATMNFNVVIFAGVFLIAGVYVVVHGKKVYTGPVAYVRKDL